jgi:hypothetical protein
MLADLKLAFEGLNTNMGLPVSKSNLPDSLNLYGAIETPREQEAAAEETSLWGPLRR